MLGCLAVALELCTQLAVGAYYQLKTRWEPCCIREDELLDRPVKASGTKRTPDTGVIATRQARQWAQVWARVMRRGGELRSDCG
mmetsp:Transcript_105952/g.182721  ORF Transcript_105952/g.182721 Transcript_105952/m.182721 type:complete len:84 (-) Transcript_105952:16-267(-)